MSSEEISPQMRVKLAANLAVLRAFEQQVDQLVQTQQWEPALMTAHTAADFAWYNSTGCLTSFPIENALKHLSDAALPRPLSRENRKPTKRILHLMSEAHHSAGGHVRMAWRWIQRDPSHIHDVIITNQPGHEGPSPVLMQAAQNTGGTVRVLNYETSSLFERTLTIRSVLNQYDMVVVNIHPYDAVAFTALATENRPKTLFFNHADHVAWLGVGITDVVVNWRPAGTRLALSRRGFHPEQCANIALAIENPAPSQRQFVRKQLGLTDDQVALITVASEYKYHNEHGPTFLDMAEKVLTQRPNAVLLAIGFGERTQWHELSKKLNGRLKVLGVQSNVSQFLDAADIYLDSFPFSSATSILEAASHGLVSVGVAVPETHELMCMRDWETNGLIVATPMAEYTQTVLQLMDDVEFRKTKSAETAETIATSLMPAWADQLQQIYALNKPVSHSPQEIKPQCTSLETQSLQVHEDGKMVKDTNTFLFHLGVTQNDINLANIELASPSITDTVIIAPTPSAGELIQILESIIESFPHENFNVVLLDNGHCAAKQVATALEGDVYIIETNGIDNSIADEVAKRSPATKIHFIDPFDVTHQALGGAGALHQRG